MNANLSLFDWILVVLLVWSTISAFLRGIIVEVCSLIGLVVGIVVAGWYYHEVADALGQLSRDFFVLSSPTWCVLSFLMVAFGVMLVFGLAARAIRRTTQTIGLGFFDRLLGAMFGLIRGCLIGTVLLMAAAAFYPDSIWISNSRLTPYFLDAAHAVSFVVPQGLQQDLLSGITQLKHNAPDWI